MKANVSSFEQSFEQNIGELVKLIDRYPFEDKMAYCGWLNQQYLLVQNSTRYLALAASAVKVDQSDEFRWWAHHLSEELDHDKTLFNDMKALGYQPQNECLPETRALIYSLYNDIQRNGADALLGYALMLEGLSCKRCNRLASRVEKIHGGKATFLRLHGNVDEEHYPNGLKRLHTFNEARRKTVMDNLEMSATLYIHMLKNLLNRFSQGSQSAA